jgi:hypothetical protein
MTLAVSKAEDSSHGGTTMTSEYDLNMRQYNPSVETALRGDDDDDDSTSVPPPPPPPFPHTIESILKDLRNSILYSARRNKAVVGVNDHPIEIVAIHENDIDGESTIEVEAGFVPWCKKTPSSAPRNRRKKKRALVWASLLFLSLFVVLVVGLSSRRNDAKRTSGASNMLVGGADTPVAETEAPVAGGTESPATTPVPPPPLGLNSTTNPPPPMVLTESPIEEQPPTDPPTQCVSFVESLETCQVPFSGISIYFRNCSPESGDWIGIWPVSLIKDEKRLPEPVLWLYNCGSQDCKQALGEDVLFFGDGLPPDTYVAQLVRLVENAAPYSSSYAVSDPFQVSPTKCE